MSGISRGRRAALLAVGLAIIGSIGPWISGLGQSIGGLDLDDGKVTLFVAGFAAAYVIIARRPHWLPTAILGAAVAFVAIYDIADISDLGGSMSLLAVDPGWGIYVAALGGLALIGAAAFVMRDEAESTGSIDLAGKLILGAGVLIVAFGVIGSLTGEEPNAVSPELRQIDPGAPTQP